MYYCSSAVCEVNVSNVALLTISICSVFTGSDVFEPSGGILHGCLGREVRLGRSNPDPV